MSKNFTFANRDPEKQRIERKNDQIELRRIQTEQLLKKKREDLDETSKKTNTAAFAKNVNDLMSSDFSRIYNSIYEFRLILSTQIDPPIQGVIETEVVPRVVSLLYRNFYSVYDELAKNIRVEAAWVLTNICTGTHEQTKIVVHAGAIAPLVAMAAENSAFESDQAIWCLGNLAGDCEEFRDLILGESFLDVVIMKIEECMKHSTDIKIFRNLVWCLSNLNRGRDPEPPFESMLKSLQVFNNTISYSDSEIVSDTLWGISYVCDVSEKLIDVTLNSPSIIARIHELLNAYAYGHSRQESNMIGKICKVSMVPLIRAIGNIVTGSEEQTQKIIDSSILPFFSSVFYNIQGSKSIRIRKDICWTISNVAAGSINQTEYVMNSDLLTIVIDALGKYELVIRKEALFALYTISRHVSDDPSALERILTMDVCGSLYAYTEAVTNYPEVLCFLLDTINNFLDAGRKIMRKTGVNPMIEHMKTVELDYSIDELKDSKNQKVSEKAKDILRVYFENEF